MDFELQGGAVTASFSGIRDQGSEIRDERSENEDGHQVNASFIDGGFPHFWQAEVLDGRPLIMPARHFIYPREAEEVERGALEVMVRPGAAGPHEGFTPIDWACAQPFLATCALGFRDPSVPTGLWSAPDPGEICAVAGGYAYLIDTSAPERFTMIPYRPVLEVRAVVEAGLLLFVASRSILAWGRYGVVWESERLSDEGVTISGVENGLLRGAGWELRTDRETPFALDVRTGRRVPAAPS